MASSKIYFTHCTYKKNNSFKCSNRLVGPDTLYTGKKIQAFIQKCRITGVNWAIFSDEYGIWLANEKHKWYDTSPRELERNIRKKEQLFQEAFQKLNHYDRVYFYANYKSSRFHHVYRSLKNELAKMGLNIRFISHLPN